jgi:hypothetical protein
VGMGGDFDALALVKLRLGEGVGRVARIGASRSQQPATLLPHKTGPASFV